MVVEPGHIKMAGALPFTKVKAVAHLKIHNPALIPPSPPAIAISDVSHISCVGNDFGFNDIFSRYVEAVGREGDVLLGISTSGNSANVIKAIAAAREKGMKVITLTGKDGGKMAGTADIEIRVPHFGYADRIQEIHIKVIHILIQLIEKEMVK